MSVIEGFHCSRQFPTLHTILKECYIRTFSISLVGGEVGLGGGTIGSRGQGRTVEDQGTTTTVPAATMIGGDTKL